MNPWISLLHKLDLSRTEQEVVKRFESDPSGRSFLPVADILRSYKYADESLELLIYGVMHHPTFTVARIVLVRELLEKGLVTDAWQALEEAKSSLRDNVLAQKLKFKLSILLGQESTVRATYRHMKVQQMTDNEISRIGEMLEMSGLAATRDRLIQDMKSRGVVPVLPSVATQPAPAEKGPALGGLPTESEAHESLESAAKPSDQDQRFAAFQVLALDEILNGVPESATSQSVGGIELDSSTLASIYEHQGHFDKALAVYRRLLRLTPSNEFLKAKISDLASRKQRQKDQDLAIDPEIADSMEQIEMIDVQMKFYRRMLERLGR